MSSSTFILIGIALFIIIIFFCLCPQNEIPVDTESVDTNKLPKPPTKGIIRSNMDNKVYKSNKKTNYIKLRHFYKDKVVKNPEKDIDDSVYVTIDNKVMSKKLDALMIKLDNIDINNKHTINISDFSLDYVFPSYLTEREIVRFYERFNVEFNISVVIFKKDGPKEKEPCKLSDENIEDCIGSFKVLNDTSISYKMNLEEHDEKLFSKDRSKTIFGFDMPIKIGNRAEELKLDYNLSDLDKIYILVTHSADCDEDQYDDGYFVEEAYKSMQCIVKDLRFKINTH